MELLDPAPNTTTLFPSTAESTQDPVEISAYVELGASGTTIDATRVSTLNQSNTVWVLLLEYTGSAGGPNELLVRDRRVHNWSSGQASTSYGPISSVVDGNKVVVFGAGSSNSNTGSSHYDRGDVRAWVLRAFGGPAHRMLRAT